MDPYSDAAKELAPVVARWVTGDDGTGIIKGRAKFCRPSFRAISKVDKELADRYFLRFKYAFHPIARKLIEKVCYISCRRIICKLKPRFKDLGLV
jgi:leukotriene-A4 hydrolase